MNLYKIETNSSFVYVVAKNIASAETEFLNNFPKKTIEKIIVIISDLSLLISK